MIQKLSKISNQLGEEKLPQANDLNAPTSSENHLAPEEIWEINPYNFISARLLLNGYKPRAMVVDQEGEIYLSMKDTAKITNLSPERLRGLVREDRLIAIKPGGYELFVSIASAMHYVAGGRRRPGRPRKIPASNPNKSQTP